MERGIALNQPQFVKAATPDAIATTLRKFRFDSETLRGNHRWVSVSATNETGHTSLFVIALDESDGSSAGSDYQSFAYRAHGAADRTEVIVGLLPSEPMTLLIQAILESENQGIELRVSTCD